MKAFDEKLAKLGYDGACGQTQPSQGPSTRNPHKPGDGGNQFGQLPDSLNDLFAKHGKPEIAPAQTQHPE